LPPQGLQAAGRSEPVKLRRLFSPTAAVPTASPIYRQGGRNRADITAGLKEVLALSPRDRRGKGIGR
jgi:hypothetical protein